MGHEEYDLRSGNKKVTCDYTVYSKYPNPDDTIAALTARIAELEGALRNMTADRDGAYNEIHDLDNTRLSLRSLNAGLVEAGDAMVIAYIAGFIATDPKDVKYECQLCEYGFYNSIAEVIHAPDCPVTMWEKAKEER